MISILIIIGAALFYCFIKYIVVAIKEKEFNRQILMYSEKISVNERLGAEVFMAFLLAVILMTMFHHLL